MNAEKRGMQLDRVVLLGRTFEEYRRFFSLSDDDLTGQRILDVAGGVSSFCAEATAQGFQVTAADPIYDIPKDELARRCKEDLDHVYQIVAPLQTYRWNFYKDRDGMRKFRERAYGAFLADLPAGLGKRYIPGSLPDLPFENDSFDIALVSYFLFVYQDHLSLDFHAQSIREIMRVARGEARIYPTVTFEGERSQYLDALQGDEQLKHLRFEEVKTDFEFLLNSNCYLRITHKS